MSLWLPYKTGDMLHAPLEGLKSFSYTTFSSATFCAKPPKFTQNSWVSVLMLDCPPGLSACEGSTLVRQPIFEVTLRRPVEEQRHAVCHTSLVCTSTTYPPRHSTLISRLP